MYLLKLLWSIYYRNDTNLTVLTIKIARSCLIRELLCLIIINQIWGFYVDFNIFCRISLRSISRYLFYLMRIHTSKFDTKHLFKWQFVYLSGIYSLVKFSYICTQIIEEKKRLKRAYFNAQEKVVHFEIPLELSFCLPWCVI